MIKSPAKPQAALIRRIRQFYAFLNDGKFNRCYCMLDPRLRNDPQSITSYQYESTLREFVNKVGRVAVAELEVAVHADKPSRLYEGRDFAAGRTTWVDALGERHEFIERWVRQNRSWYTRSTGLIAP